MNETIEQNALYEQTYGVGYRRGIEEELNRELPLKKKRWLLICIKKEYLWKRYLNVRI